MTAFQPNPDHQTAQAELGGQRPDMTPEYARAIGDTGLRIVAPKVAARQASVDHFTREFGLTGDTSDLGPDHARRVHDHIERIKLVLQGKTMLDAPYDLSGHPPAQGLSPEDIRQKTHQSWDEIEARIVSEEESEQPTLF